MFLLFMHEMHKKRLKITNMLIVDAKNCTNNIILSMNSCWIWKIYPRFAKKCAILN